MPGASGLQPKPEQGQKIEPNVSGNKKPIAAGMEKIAQGSSPKSESQLENLIRENWDKVEGKQFNLVEHKDHDQEDHGNWASGKKKIDDYAKTAVDVGGDIELAAKLLGEGKHIKLEHPRQVSVLLDRLGSVAQQMKSEGKKALNYDLCKVHLPVANLFCKHSKGIPRARMPQLSGLPKKGSPAFDLPRVPFRDLPPEKLHVDVSPMFMSHLKDRGFGIEDLDGHHRWASTVGHYARDNDFTNDPKIEIRRVDINIGELIFEAHNFASDMGLPTQSAFE